MKRKVIARLLVFCMLLTMMAVPTSAVTLDNVAWTSNAYTLTENTYLIDYSISNGTFRINLNGYYLNNSSVTVQDGATLSVYKTSDDNTLLYEAKGKVTLDNYAYYNTADSTYTISGSVRLESPNSTFEYLADAYIVGLSVTSGVGNYEKYIESTDGGYTTYGLKESVSGGGGSGSGSSGSTAASSLVEPASEAAVAAAKASGKPVALPTTVTVASSRASAPVITVDVPATVNSSNPIDVELPVSNVKATTVVVLVKADGTEEIIKDAALTDKGLVFTVTGDTKVKVVENAKTFRDSAAVSSWAKESVDFVTSRELFNGTDKGFEPSISMNRGMFAQVLYNYMGRPAVSGEGFADAKGMWYNAAATWANSVGVVLGDDSGNFKGDAAITRQDLVTMLYRFASSQKFDTTLPTESVLGGFNDAASVADYAQTAMEWAVANGIMNGMDGGINPTGSATREMVAAFVARFCNNVIH